MDSNIFTEQEPKSVHPLTCAGADCPASWRPSRIPRNWRTAPDSYVSSRVSSGCRTSWNDAGSTCTRTRISGAVCVWNPVCGPRQFASPRTFCQEAMLWRAVLGACTMISYQMSCAYDYVGVTAMCENVTAM